MYVSKPISTGSTMMNSELIASLTANAMAFFLVGSCLVLSNSLLTVISLSNVILGFTFSFMVGSASIKLFVTNLIKSSAGLLGSNSLLNNIYLNHSF